LAQEIKPSRELASENSQVPGVVVNNSGSLLPAASEFDSIETMEKIRWR
jgi:hypothetical protein